MYKLFGKLQDFTEFCENLSISRKVVHFAVRGTAAKARIVEPH